MVKIFVLGTLGKAVAETEIDLELNESMTVQRLVEHHSDQLGALLPFILNGEVLTTVNRRIAMPEFLLKNGDVVKLSYHSRNVGYDGARDIPT